MIKKNLKESYTDFHKKRNQKFVYPPEWLVRLMLGSYPKINLDKGKYLGAKVLDVGFGDGRSFPLLHNLGFKIHGIEITDEIVKMCRDRMNRLGIQAKLRIGTNTNIPYPNNYFDYIIACSSCYYIDENTSFQDTLREYSRVLKKNGILICSLPHKGMFYFRNCIERSDGSCVITSDNYGIRNGYILQRFKTKNDIKKSFSKYFHLLAIGLLKDDYWGHQVNMYLVVAKKLE
ncbi:MAG: class I SAM-dependent methyltransferase [Candidatus Helarchaeota archaeon]